MKNKQIKREPPRVRNFVAKNSAIFQRGAGAHRDKKHDYQRREKYAFPLIRQRDEKNRPVLILAA